LQICHFYKKRKRKRTRKRKENAIYRKIEAKKINKKEKDN
jgi:hypothetical protein